MKTAQMNPPTDEQMKLADAKVAATKATEALEAERAALTAADAEIEDAERASATAAPSDLEAAVARLAVAHTRREVLTKRMVAAKEAEDEARRVLAEAEAEAKRVELERLDAPIREADAAITAFVKAAHEELLSRVATLRALVEKANRVARLPFAPGPWLDSFSRTGPAVAAARHTTWADAAPLVFHRALQVVDEEPIEVFRRRQVAAEHASMARAQIEADERARREMGERLAAMEKLDPERAAFLKLRGIQ